MGEKLLQWEKVQRLFVSNNQKNCLVIALVVLVALIALILDLLDRRALSPVELRSDS